MFFTIKKNSANTWDIIPNSGAFAGVTVATAECVDLTSVVANVGQVVGMLKAVWGLQFSSAVDVYADIETVRALCLGKAFKGVAGRPVRWSNEGLYDMDSSRILRNCRRLVMLGSSIFRRD